MGDLVGQKDADLRLEVEDTGDTNAGADDAQAHQMVFEMILPSIVICATNGDRTIRLEFLPRSSSTVE
ncbi:hypothetical protein ALC60_05356 [Trachymyrmex zeteki]|uniref:Uncharacterized protein n=1 Tax=Mycetomoellerius zeteki TaxID=64791 RepID=A0A151X5U8_9HYME|nr:hypothetical protein ALC60_05356 [Trachymyrmex zeteki]